MRKPLLILAFLLTFGYGVNAQCVQTDTDPCISVKQSTLDRAMKAVDELISARDLIEKQLVALKATDAERKAWVQFQTITESAIAIFQKGLVDRDKLIDLQGKVIETMVQLNDKLLAQLNKKPSTWDKLVNAVKLIATVVLGIGIGRGL